MELHSTASFNDARQRADIAHAKFGEELVKPDFDENDPHASDDEIAAFLNFILHPAATPSELQAKLSAAIFREVYMWADWPDFLAVVKADLARMQAVTTGPDVTAALLAWRAAYEPWVTCGPMDDDDPAYLKMNEDRSAAYHALLDARCTTPGDLLTKTYVNLLESVGHSLVGEASKNGNGNIFDVHIEQCDSHRDEDEAFQRAAYRDLDHCDLGANLLAYGLPYFSAQHWIARAEAVGLRPWCVTIEGRDRFGLGFDDSDLVPDAPGSERMRRERNRLRRILAFDADRAASIIAEIKVNHPRLVAKAFAIADKEPVPA